MTDPQDLLRLADEVAAATGPSLLLDRDIALAIYPQALPVHGTDARVSVWDGNGRTQLTVKPFTVLLDAAKTLVPAEHDVQLTIGWGEPTEAVVAHHLAARNDHIATAATPALALCAAALKARAHSTKESENG